MNRYQFLRQNNLNSYKVSNNPVAYPNNSFNILINQIIDHTFLFKCVIKTDPFHSQDIFLTYITF